jgi:hypothetical protein
MRRALLMMFLVCGDLTLTGCTPEQLAQALELAKQAVSVLGPSATEATPTTPGTTSPTTPAPSASPSIPPAVPPAVGTPGGRAPPPPAPPAAAAAARATAR